MLTTLESDGQVMSRMRRRTQESREVVVDDLNDQVFRLRQMLILMAPDTGTSALGATFTGYRDKPREKPQLLLPSPKAANF
jgi:hypothetical protein